MEFIYNAIVELNELGKQIALESVYICNSNRE